MVIYGADSERDLRTDVIISLRQVLSYLAHLVVMIVISVQHHSLVEDVEQRPFAPLILLLNHLNNVSQDSNEKSFYY